MSNQSLNTLNNPDTAVEQSDSGFISLPRQEYQELMDLLAQYEQRFGPIEPAQEAAACNLPESFEAGKNTELAQESLRQDILDVLTQEEESLLDTSLLEEALLDVADTSAIRHYGFKRVKHR